MINPKELPKKEKLLVFDIDNTLTESASLHIHSFKQILNEEGYKLFNDDFGTYKHHTDKYVYSEIIKNNTGKECDIEDLKLFERKLFNLIFSKTQEHPLKPIKGAVAFIEHILEKTGYAIAFATGSMRKPAIYKLEETGIPYDEKLLTASNMYNRREDIVKAAIRQAQTFWSCDSFKKVISIGDGAWDLKTAQKLNLEFVGIRNTKLFASLGCEVSFTDFDDEDIYKILL